LTPKGEPTTGKKNNLQKNNFTIIFTDAYGHFKHLTLFYW
jgi:hypothetical protein